LDCSPKLSDILVQSKILESYRQTIHGKSNPAIGQLREPSGRAARVPLGGFAWQETDYSLHLSDAKNLQATVNQKVPFDQILLRYIFESTSSASIRSRAMAVLAQHFNQRRTLLKELTRVQLIISEEEYMEFKDILDKRVQFVMLSGQLIRDEMYHLFYKKGPGTENAKMRSDIINFLRHLTGKLLERDDEALQRLQNIFSESGFLADIVINLLKRLIYKEASYKDLF
jgi:hypothetical protein